MRKGWVRVMVGCRAHRFHSPTGGRAQITSSSLRACFCCAALHLVSSPSSLLLLLHFLSSSLLCCICFLFRSGASSDICCWALFSEVLRRSLSLSLSLYVSLSLCLCDPVFPTLTASVSRYVWNFERCKAISSMWAFEWLKQCGSFSNYPFYTFSIRFFPILSEFHAQFSVVWRNPLFLFIFALFLALFVLLCCWFLPSCSLAKTQWQLTPPNSANNRWYCSMSCFSHVFGCSTTSTLLSIWRRRLKQADSSQARHKIQVWDQFSFSFYVRFCGLYSGFVF